MSCRGYLSKLGQVAKWPFLFPGEWKALLIASAGVRCRCEMGFLFFMQVVSRCHHGEARAINWGTAKNDEMMSTSKSCLLKVETRASAVQPHMTHQEILECLSFTKIGFN